MAGLFILGKFWILTVLTVSVVDVPSLGKLVEFLLSSDDCESSCSNTTTAVGRFSTIPLCRTRPPGSAPGNSPVYLTWTSISSALFSLTDRRLMFAGRPRSMFRPSSSTSRGAIVVALLLLLGGVEPNPGPAGLRLGLINVRSAVGKAALIHDVISHHHLDVLIVTETWMRADQPPAIVDDIAPPDYAVSHRFRSGGQGGGVAIVHRRSLKLSTLTSVSGSRAFECLAVKLSTAGRRLNIGAIYRPPSSSTFGVSVSSFCVEFAEFLDEFLAMPGDPLLCGDFNCPGGVGAVDDQLQDVLSDRFLHQLVDHPTHHAGNTLDLIITHTDGNLANGVSVDDVGISDHALVSVDLNLHRPAPNTRRVTYRNIKTVDPVKFTELIGAEKIYTSPPADVDAFADELDASVTRVMDMLAPARSRTVRVGKRSTKWLSTSAVASKRRRRRFERRWRRTRAEVDRVAYRASCRAANLEINRSRQTFFQERLTTAGADQKARWKVVRELLHVDDQREDLAPEEARRLSTDFAKFFSNKLRRVAEEVCARLAMTAGISRSLPSRSSLVYMDTLRCTDAAEVARLIRQAPPKSSPLDCMPTSLLKATADVMAPLLAQLANMSFTTGVFPTRYKSGHVIPLLKKSGLPKDDPANYRPITNLSTFSKILERLALSRLRPHVLASGNYCSFQSAYRAGYSTETALLKIVNDIRTAAGQGKCTVLLALDISAAFDAVHHATLCQRLQRTFGLEDRALHWLRSFVSDRCQYIAVGGERSDTVFCDSGVPQGSVLGPLLFSLYVAPVSDVIAAHGISVHQYADDIQTYISLYPQDMDDLSQLADCTADVSRWFLESSLLLNPAKTEAVVFGTAARLKGVDSAGGIMAAGARVQFVEAIKLLGVTLDPTLSMDRHVANVAQSCSYHTRALRHIRPVLSLDCAKDIATSIVGTRLDYCNSLLFGTSQRNFDRLQRLQNNLARVVLQAPARASATDLRRELHWLPIVERVKFKIATLTFKAKHGVPDYLGSLLTVYQPTRTLRSSDNGLLYRPRTSSDFESYCFRSAAPTIWNSLSVTTRTANSIGTFRSRLKTDLFAKAYAA